MSSAQNITSSAKGSLSLLGSSRGVSRGCGDGLEAELWQVVPLGQCPANRLSRRAGSAGDGASALGFLGGMTVVPKHEVYPWMKCSVPCASELSFKSFTR